MRQINAYIIITTIIFLGWAPIMSHAGTDEYPIPVVDTLSSHGPPSANALVDCSLSNAVSVPLTGCYNNDPIFNQPPVTGVAGQVVSGGDPVSQTVGSGSIDIDLK
jgi:hypothetical protein